jgi:hypothetical protein
VQGWVNDAARGLIGVLLRAVGCLLQLRQRWRVATFRWSQARLRRRYRICPATPVTDKISPIDEAEIPAFDSPTVRIAQTSGSTGRSKQVPFTKQRLRMVRLTFIDVFVRCFWNLGAGRTSLYVFGSLGSDDSLSSLLLEEARTPSYLTTLQAPYRLQSHPALQELKARYGTTALRLWILTLSNPGAVYSTNPSTLSTFFDDLNSNWTACSALVRDYVRDGGNLESSTDWIVRRLDSVGSRERLDRVATSPDFVSMSDWAPAVETYVCWTGGYVGPFLERLEMYLPSPRYRLVPMYSMSTETIETVTHFHGGGTSFLPMGSGVFYEFLEENGNEGPERFETGDRLQTGKQYRMVVSHPFGLRRYQTGDVFLVDGFVGHVPDLRFLRRSGLAYSFTGEKLTGEQLGEAYGRLREEYDGFKDGSLMTCFPSHPSGEPIPHYRLALITLDSPARNGFPEIAERLDTLLLEINGEYKNKRTSKRLGAVRSEQISMSEFQLRMPAATQDGWDSQFKFLPLYPYLWESLEQP